MNKNRLTGKLVSLLLTLCILFACAAAAGETALVSLVGDCSIGDAIQYIGYGSSYHACLEKNGMEWPFSLVRDYFLSDDLTVANLEVVLTELTAHKNKVFPLRGKPEFARVLKLAGIEAVNTVNNHCEDFKRGGYKDTLKALEAEGILYFGSNRPTNKKNGYNYILVTEAGGLRFGILGISYPQNNDYKWICSEIPRLKGEEGCDVVIVSLHWGQETHKLPTKGQISNGKKLIDAGADVIYGHHAHVLQPIHFYKGKPILYSTGNFTFGTMSNVDPDTGIFQLTWEKTADGTELKQLRVIPCRTQKGPDFRPYELEDETERKALWQKLIYPKDVKDCDTLPASFAETGIVDLVHGAFAE